MGWTDGSTALVTSGAVYGDFGGGRVQVSYLKDRGIAFVKMRSVDAAKAAVQAVAAGGGAEVGGSRISVSHARGR